MNEREEPYRRDKMIGFVEFRVVGLVVDDDQR